jgi:hypothetical protein
MSPFMTTKRDTFAMSSGEKSSQKLTDFLSSILDRFQKAADTYSR